MSLNKLLSKSLAGITVPVLILSLTACGMLGDRRDSAHQGATSGRALDVPPDLLPPEVDATYRIPAREDGRVSAVEAERRQQPGGILGAGSPADPAVASGQVAPSELGDVSIRREAGVRWLELRAEPEEIWAALRGFWGQLGYELERDEPRLGIMETEWLERRAGVEVGGFRGVLSRSLGTVYDAGYRDQFRIRLEREAEGVTALYLSHRGVEQVPTTAEGSGLRWVGRPSDPELEAEMLTRLMIYLGQDEGSARAALTVDDEAPRMREREEDGQPGIELRGEFTQVWRRVGLGLDRAGLLVDDQDRSRRIFHVTFNPDMTDTRSEGFFGRMFRRDPVGAGDRYQIRLVQQEDGWTRVTAHTREGDLLNARDARRVLDLLFDELR
jgi:outer membrane protein assembly factor BamC